jgi:hypothetical protein
MHLHPFDESATAGDRTASQVQVGGKRTCTKWRWCSKRKTMIVAFSATVKFESPETSLIVPSWTDMSLSLRSGQSLSSAWTKPFLNDGRVLIHRYSKDDESHVLHCST